MIHLILLIVVSAQHYSQLTGTLTSIQNSIQCQTMPSLTLIELSTELSTINVVFTINEPHYGFQVIADFYCFGNWIDDHARILVDGVHQDTFQYKNAIYNFNKGTTDPLNNSLCYKDIPSYMTSYVHSFNHYQTSLNLTIVLQVDSQSQNTMGVRNVYVKPLICHPTCAQCSGPSSNDCRSCHTEAIMSKSNNHCRCPNQKPYLSLLQCVTHCRQNEQPNQYNICIPNPLIISINQYFWITMIADDWNVTDGLLVQSGSQFITQITTNSLFGLFSQQHIISTQLKNIPQYTVIRFRAHIYQYGTSLTPKIQLQLGQVKQLVTPLYTQPCNKPDVCLIHYIDTYIDISVNATLSLNLVTSSWGIRNIYIDYIDCQANCDKCNTKTTCATCVLGYYLYKGTCLQSCPTNSIPQGNKCKDLDELTDYSLYLQNNFTSNDPFDYYMNGVFTIGASGAGYDIQGIRHYGSPLNGYAFFFNRRYSDLQPHYQIRMQAQVMTHNTTSEESNYVIQTHLNGEQMMLNIPFSESIKYTKWEQIVKTNVSNSIEISFINNPKISVMAIRDYSLIIDLCYPLCRQCTGSRKEDCTDWIVEANSNSTSNTCNQGYLFNLQQQKCQLCPIGCAVCLDSNTCQVCEASYLQQGSTCYCQNGVIDEESLECIKTTSNKRMLSYSYIEQRIHEIRNIM